MARAFYGTRCKFVYRSGWVPGPILTHQVGLLLAIPNAEAVSAVPIKVVIMLKF